MAMANELLEAKIDRLEARAIFGSFVTCG